MGNEIYRNILVWFTDIFLGLRVNYLKGFKMLSILICDNPGTHWHF